MAKFKNDAVAGVERGKDFSGIHHFGFQVENLEDITERLAAAGAPRRDDVNEALGVGHGDKHYANVEVKYSGPDNVMVDVWEKGWVGTSEFHPKGNVKNPAGRSKRSRCEAAPDGRTRGVLSVR